MVLALARHHDGLWRSKPWQRSSPRTPQSLACPPLLLWVCGRRAPPARLRSWPPVLPVSSGVAVHAARPEARSYAFRNGL